MHNFSKKLYLDITGLVVVAGCLKYFFLFILMFSIFFEFLAAGHGFVRGGPWHDPHLKSISRVGSCHDPPLKIDF